MAEILQLRRALLADLKRDPDLYAREIHKQLDRSCAAVPVEDIARVLEIDEIRKTELDGYEGMLLTTPNRSMGKILISTRGGSAHPLQHRARDWALCDGVAPVGAERQLHLRSRRHATDQCDHR